MRIARSAALAGLLLPFPACDTLTAPDAAGVGGVAYSLVPGSEVMFNPQPEPPANILSFTANGPPDGRWVGRYRARSGESGALLVETLSALQRDGTLHVQQEWTLHPPDPVHPPDPIHPPDPVVPPLIVALSGVLDLRRGQLVLHGRTTTGIGARALGTFVATGGGIAAFGGELMFNPQPEPPAER